jgi:glycosyltransferase involved in cell wall biosynthesis
MKTLCIMDWVSRTNAGLFEAERRLQQTLQAKVGIEVEVVGLEDAMTEADRPNWLPLSPVALPVTGPRSFGYAAGFADVLSESNADLGCLVGLWKYPALSAHRWSRKSGKPLLIAPHGMLDPWALRHSGYKKKVAAWLFQNAQLRRAACLRALCAAEAASFRAYGLKNPVCVIPNGIDLPAQEERNAPRHPRFPAERKVLLYLGRIHPKKGLVRLLEAWAASAKAGWLLAIAGWDQGGHEAALKRQATDRGIVWTDSADGPPEASILFLGPQFGQEKASCYASCDAFILPSVSEGLPMVVLEAWAYGKPVLMTPECNLPEGFATGAALRFQTTSESIEAGLRKLFGLSVDDLRTMGQNGRKLVEDKFDWRKVAVQMASVYEWILGGGAKPDCLEGA